MTRNGRERFGKIALQGDHEKALRSFDELLEFHMQFGTRPDGNPERAGIEWTAKELAEACDRDNRTVRNWRNGATVPSVDDIAVLCTALFGENAALASWKAEFRTAPRLRRRSLPNPGKSSPSTSPKPRNLPFASLGERFKGRETDMDRLQEALSALGSDALVVGHAVHGLGGVGKTRLAVEYACRHEAHYSALIFLPASQPSEMATALGRLCEADMLDLPEQKDHNEERRKAAALRWLEANPTWLMILDNVDDEEALEAVEKLRSRLRGGRLLITGRMATWPAGITPLNLDMLSHDAATAYLLDASGARRTEEDQAAASRLATYLGGLALALEIAAAYVRTQPGMNLTRYAELWRTEHRSVAARINRGFVHFDHHTDLATVWSASMARLSPNARRLLECLSFVAPEPIPDTFFDLPVPGEGEGYDVRTSLSELLNASLVARAMLGEEPAYTVHRLMQEATRDGLHGQRRADAAYEAVLWLYPPFSKGVLEFRLLAAVLPFVPHVEAATRYALQGVKSRFVGATHCAGWLTIYLGDIQYTRGTLENAKAIFSRACSTFKQINEDDKNDIHAQRDLSVSLQRIANVYLSLGDPNAALDALRKSLATRRKLAENDRFNPAWQRGIAISQQRIGAVELEFGDRFAAHAALREALTISRRLASMDPSNTDWSRDLSTTYDVIGNAEILFEDYGAALLYYREALEIREKMLKRDGDNTEWQRDVGITHDRIGSAHLCLRDKDAAVESFRKSFAIADALVALDRANVTWRRDLAISHFKLAQANDAPVTHYTAALNIVQQLSEEGRLSPTDTWMIAEFERRLAAATSATETPPAAVDRAAKPRPT